MVCRPDGTSFLQRPKRAINYPMKISNKRKIFHSWFTKSMVAYKYIYTTEAAFSSRKNLTYVSVKITGTYIKLLCWFSKKQLVR